MINKKRFFISTVMAWLLFLMLDFLAHAALLSHFWEQKFSALKSLQELFRLIPFGYLSFLILVVLVGWLYIRLYWEKGNTIKGISFGALFGGLYALSTFFSWFSALNLPIIFIFLISLVYFAEIVGIGFTFGYLMHPPSIKKRIWVLVVIIIFGFFMSLILQNIGLLK